MKIFTIIDTSNGRVVMVRSRAATSRIIGCSTMTIYRWTLDNQHYHYYKHLIIAWSDTVIKCRQKQEEEQ